VLEVVACSDATVPMQHSAKTWANFPERDLRLVNFFENGMFAALLCQGENGPHWEILDIASGKLETVPYYENWQIIEVRRVEGRWYSILFDDDKSFRALVLKESGVWEESSREVVTGERSPVMLDIRSSWKVASKLESEGTSFVGLGSSHLASLFCLTTRFGVVPPVLDVDKGSEVYVFIENSDEYQYLRCRTLSGDVLYSREISDKVRGCLVFGDRVLIWEDKAKFLVDKSGDWCKVEFDAIAYWY
jgi:hypothetical protein